MSVVLTGFTDRFTLFRACCTPKRYSHTLMSVLALWLQTVCWWHCAFAVWMFGMSASLPSHCPRCEGDNKLFGLIDITPLERLLVWVEEDILQWKNNYVGMILDHVMMSSAQPNLMVLMGITVIGQVRFVYFACSRGVSSLAAVDPMKKVKKKKADEAVVGSTASSAAAEPEAAVVPPAPLDASGLAESLQNLWAGEAAPKRASRLSGVVESFQIDWESQPPSWKKFLNPLAKQHVPPIFGEPFAGAPLADMKRNRVATSYELRDAFFEEINAAHSHDGTIDAEGGLQPTTYGKPAKIPRE